VIAEACNKAIATTLAAWEPLKGVDGPVSVAMGCKDGSVYIFQSDPTASSPTDSLVQETALSPKALRPTSSRTGVGFPNVSRLQRPPSPTGSSTSGSALLKASGSSKHASFQPSRSRVESGVSKEQVEAPKSHVDYGDEAAKLKSLLKPRDTKERGLIESLMPSLNLGHHHQRAHSSETHSQPVERTSTYSQISTAQVSSTSASASPPISPTVVRFPQTNIDTSTDGLRLAIHTFPPRFGQGRAVTALEYMEDGALLASLQECG
jgi:WD repeat-containing protein 7